MSDTNEAPTRVGGSNQSDVAGALEEYLTLVEAGQRPGRTEFLARHAAIAHELADALDGLNFVRSAAADLPSPAAAEGLPSTLGDYRIVREVGRGGMGVVYEAEQISLRRRVALKVLPFAAVMDPRNLQRFKNEALAAASLDHPHVVKVHGVGCERGIHFIALQYVDGRPLSELIRERRDGTPAETLPTAAAVDTTCTYAADRTDESVSRPASASRTPADAAYVRRVAGWGVEVADALEHAHALGVVHRDVKPGNILVDGTGRAYVADFGLARLATDPGVTASGDLLGTLRYMSPEQAAAKHDLVDHRSDVYSLGVTLYELLTLAPAFAGSSRAEVLRAVADTDPSPPRSQDRTIPRDLETVVLKGMDKDPARRYQSAGELAADLRRFLADEPVLAGRPTLLDRAAKWARRHRAAVASAVALLVVTTAVSTAAALLIADRQAGKDRALGEKDEALREKDQALEERGAALDQATSQKKRAEETLTEAVALLYAVPTDYPTMAKNDGNYNQVINLQRRSAVVLERVTAERPDDRDLLRQLWNMYSALHFSAGHARRLHQCVDTARRAVVFWEERGITERGTATEAGQRLALALLFTTLGEAQLAAGDADGAADAFHNALDNWTTCTTAVPAFGPFNRREVARARGGRAAAMAAQGKYDDAAGEYRAALALLNEPHEKEAAAKRQAAAAPPLWHRLGDVLWASGQKKEAGEAYAAAKAGWEKLEPETKQYHTADLAWLLAVCPDPAVRDRKAALEYASAVKPGTPGGALAALVVTVVTWRAGKAPANLDLKDPSPADEAALVASFAVALHRRGEATEARKQLDRATQAAKKCGEDPEVRRLLAEAAAALSEPPPPPPGK